MIFSPKNLIFALFFGVLLTFPVTTNAQLGLNESFTLNINPLYPEPGELVSADIVSFATDLDRAEVFWYLNGSLSASGIGKKEFSFNVGESGAKTTLTVVAAEESGKKFQKSIVINPSSVDLIWEANTYTPDFFNGKALHSSESEIKVTAMPRILRNGVPVSANNLVYKWKRNGIAMQDQSGYGKRSIVFDGAKTFGSDYITVEVSTVDNAVTSSGKVTIRPFEPQILFYLNDDFGVRSERVLGSSETIFVPEFTLKAEPYYFSLKELEDSKTNYSWTVNGRTVNPHQTNKNLITFRQEGGGGRGTVTLEIINLAKRLQSAAKSISLSFDL